MDIAALSMQIHQWRRELGMPAEPSWHMVAFPWPALHACTRDARPDDDTCALATAICDNAEQICIVAGELGDNLWARNTCANATRSCSEVGQRCCALRGS